MENLTFGTDGIRGIYGETLTTEVAYRLGAALGAEGDVLIGRDNRPSSPALAEALSLGVTRAGGRPVALGLTTTPALYYVLTRLSLSHAVMITASHNPPAHNGLKVFTPDGKLTEEARKRLERKMRETRLPSLLTAPLEEDPSPLDLYVDFYREAVGRLNGMTAVVDYAGGAGYAFRDLLGSLGVKVRPLDLRERGDRINEKCGALHPENCAEAVRRLGADVGISIDGDGDRIIAVDSSGEILDGDRIVHLFACRMKGKGLLKKDKVALTVMTNSGVLKSLSERGITAVSCAVGDAAVAQTMRAEGLNLGGEQSGHVILGDHLMTGDALLVGGMLMKSIREEGPLSLTSPPTVYPQVLLNVRVKDKRVAYDPALQSLAAEIKEELEEGRVLLRASGTEEVVRVMVEHPNESRARLAAERLKEAILSLTR